MPVYNSTNPNLWLGIPRTAINVLPLTAGLRYAAGDNQASRGGASRLRLQGAQITNAAAAGAVGLVTLLPDSAVAIGTWTASTTTYADVTAASQGSGADLITTVSTTTNNGFVVGALLPFNVICAELSTAAGGTPVLDYAYWGQPTTGLVGTAGWQAVATNLITWGSLTGTGEKLAVLNVPFDLMVKTAAGDFTGAPGGYYFVRVRATTAATTTAGQSAHIYAGVELARQTSLGQNAQFNLAGGTGGMIRTLTGGVALGGFFATTNAGNHVYLEYE